MKYDADLLVEKKNYVDWYHNQIMKCYRGVIVDVADNASNCDSSEQCLFSECTSGEIAENG